MAKYSLGTAKTKMGSKMRKGDVYLDKPRAESIKNDMIKQFDNITASLTQINADLNKAVAKKVVKGSYAEAFKGWSKKCKAQATASKQRRTTLSSKFGESVRLFSMKLLEDKIADLLRRVTALENK